MISSILYELPDLLHHLDAGTIIILVGSNVIFFSTIYFYRNCLANSCSVLALTFPQMTNYQNAFFSRCLITYLSNRD